MRNKLASSAPAARAALVAVLAPKVGLELLAATAASAFLLVLLVTATILFGSAALSARAMRLLCLMLRQAPDPYLAENPQDGQ